MGLDNAIYALSNFNAIMGSINGYKRDKQDGIPTDEAITNLGWNMANGVLRNEASREILYRNGSYMGYAVNSLAGYGDPEANYNGTMGTIAAAMLTQPFGIFGNRCCHTSTLYGCGGFGGGYFGGYDMYTPFTFSYTPFSGPSFFSHRGCWC